MNPIAVTGGGCIGLFTAYHLWNLGFEKITIYAESFTDLTSHHAGGLLSFRTAFNDQTTNKLILKMGEDTYQFFKTIALGHHPDFLVGASLIPTYFENLASSELEDLVGRGMEPAKNVILNFGYDIQREMIAYDDSIFMDTGEMMERLQNFLQEKVSFKKRKIHSFTELPESIIFNCTGLGSKELNQDDLLYPVQGHLVILKNQKPLDLQYMLIVDFESKEDNDKGICRTLDFFPKKLFDADQNDVGVLGGTFIKASNMLNSNSDTQEFDRIIDRAKHFFYQDKD